MKAPASQAEREHRLGLVVGLLMLLITGLALYPPAVFGGVGGIGLGAGLGRNASVERAARVRRVLLGVCASLLSVIAIGEVLGVVVGEERRAFLAEWGARGPLNPQLEALATHPWGWLPQTIAIGAISAAVALAVRGAR